MYGYDNPDLDKYAKSLKKLINELSGYYYVDKLTKAPLFIGLDFESNKFTSLPHGIYGYNPPSSLALASTGDADVIYDIGLSVGLLLKEIGVNVLFGPSLDLERSPQGDLYSVTGNRTYSDNVNRLVSAAGYYLDGLAHSGVSSYVKHFPGHGAVSGNPHSESEVLFIGQKHELENGLIPYRKLSEKYSGIVTSHVWYDLDSKPVTFHKDMVNGLIEKDGIIKLSLGDIEGLALDKIVVTDDLSDMGVLGLYTKADLKKNINLAHRALEAGHDLLLYSHLNLPGFIKGRSSMGIDFKKLIEIRDSIRDYYLSSNKVHELDKVVEKILKEKSRSGIWDAYEYEETKNIFFDIDGIKSEYIKGSRKNLKSIEELFYLVYEESYVKFNNRIDFSSANIDVNKKVMFFYPEDYPSYLMDNISNMFSNVKFIENMNDKQILCDIKKHSIERCNSFKNNRNSCDERAGGCVSRLGYYYNYIKTNLSSYDYLVFPVRSLDDARVIERLYFSAPDSGVAAETLFMDQSIEKTQGVLLRDKIVLLLYTSPKLLNTKMLSNVDVIVLYDDSKDAYEKGVDLLSNGVNDSRVYPNKTSCVRGVPISLGNYGVYYNEKYSPDIAAGENLIIPVCNEVASQEYLDGLKYIEPSSGKIPGSENIKPSSWYGDILVLISTYWQYVVFFIICIGIVLMLAICQRVRRREGVDNVPSVDHKDITFGNFLFVFMPRIFPYFGKTFNKNKFFKILVLVIIGLFLILVIVNFYTFASFLK